MLNYVLYIFLETGMLVGQGCTGQASVSHITPYGEIEVDCTYIQSTYEVLPPIANYELEVRLNALQFQHCRALYTQLSETEVTMFVECPGFSVGFEGVTKGK